MYVYMYTYQRQYLYICIDIHKNVCVYMDINIHIEHTTLASRAADDQMHAYNREHSWPITSAPLAP